MQVDFFLQGQKTSISNELFGICDDSSGFIKKPAYINIQNREIWIAEVHNHTKKNVDFYAIDGCVKWSLPNGNQAKACDGMLTYNERKRIVFVELKDKKTNYKNWKIRAEEQLKSSIEGFLKYHNEEGVLIKAYACNKQLLFEEGEEEFLQKFKDDTGVTLRVFREIEIV